MALNHRLGVRLAALLFFVPAPLLAQREYRIGPPPAWVTAIHPDLTSPPPTASVTDGYELLLVDHQEVVSRSGREQFQHVTYRLLDESAVAAHSQLELSFDPTYEQLTLHTVTVRRNGIAIDQLKPDRIRVVKQESQMDYQIFDGSLSFVLVLEDVRRDDVVEYSYTRRGSNPVFAGHYMAEMSLQASVPIRAMYFRLLWPDDRPLFIRPHDTKLEPSVTTMDGQREYLWQTTNVPPKVLDQGLPDWYDPFPGVQLSDFASWAQVAAWGDTLFRSPGPTPGPLTERLARIRSGNVLKEAQALAALRYVQEEVRYLGIEIGVNSHTPYPIATVLRRGYGDCKDKALLLVTMLRALDIPAWPALVSTTERGHVRDYHPTAAHFDHAIVLAEVDGHEYWLDPTALYQRGSLESVAAQFDAGLPLGRATDSLATVPHIPAADPVTDVTVSFELAEVGKPATMRVETDYRGRTANGVRARTRGTAIEKLEREYTEYYAESYPGIRSEAEPQIDDNEATNLVHTTERYTIPSFWHPSAYQDGDVGTFDPLELDEAIPSPTSTDRTMPLDVDHPVHFRYTITANLAGGWAIPPRSDTVVTPAIRFVRSIEAEGMALTLRYEYETLADHVQPAAAADHLEKLSRLRRLLPFSVSAPTTTTNALTDPHEVNWPVLLAGLLVTGLAILGAIRLNRSPPPAWPAGPVPLATPQNQLSGLRGWLAFLGLGVSFTPVKIFLDMVKTAPTYTASSWTQHTAPGGVSYDPLWAPTLLFELVTNIVLLVFGCLLVRQYFGRKRWFPALFVIIAVARVILIWSDALLAYGIPTVRARGIEWSRLLAMTVILAFWAGYMFRSRRVHNTFVN